MDPDRYAKQRNIRPDSKWKVLQSLLSLALILCGLVGIAVHVFNRHFKLLDAVYWIKSSAINAILTLLGAILLYLFHRYVTTISDARHQSASNLPVYFMMLMGLFFIVRLITTGHW